MDKTKVAVNDKVAEEYKALLDRIPYGAHQAISMKVLADSFDMKPAELREYVLKARIDGCFILSGQNGYYLPETAADIRSYSLHRCQYIKTAQKAVSPLLHELSRIVKGA